MRWLAVVPLALALACSHASPSASIAAAAPAPEAAAPAAPSCGRDADCGASQLCIRSRCVDITPALAECGTVRVHFDFDEAELRPSELPLLERSARCLAADAGLHVLIEGNADERGTEEYNLALGDRRASSVERYLERLGAPAERLRTVSYGKERPLCADHDEACWSQNRRAAVRPGPADASR